ncbi:hypothetical protein AK830_g7946 [Neonectria ditissima]|uniref:Uncharacterized protein n=1 Tax=Neonectria ditissima TaxID=78410 RepID=A0A0P7AVP6_9HYPO|nr:hypothetical protein AK830_g7946 [Neonectria ditissima]
MKVTDIPNITHLRRELDYGHARIQRDIVFYNTLRSYITTFTSSNGIPGVEFLRWKFRPHQFGLLEMVSSFLDKDGKGSHFWPDQADAPNYGKLQYSKERSRIRRLLTQLFFKVNQQHHWKRTNSPPPMESAEPTPQMFVHLSWGTAGAQRQSIPEPQRRATVNDHQGGHSTEDAIDLDSYFFDEDSLTETKPDKSAWDNATTATPEPPYTSQSFELSSRERLERDDQRLPEAVRTRGDSTQAAPVAPMNDPFDVPYTREPDVPPAATESPSIDKRPAPDDSDEDAPLAKRPRCQGCGKRHLSGRSIKDPFHGAVPSRSPSSRQRRHPYKDGFLFGSEYEEVLQSPPSSEATSASTPDLEDSRNADFGTEPMSAPSPDPRNPAQTGTDTVKDASQATVETSNPKNPPQPASATVKGGFPGSNIETEPVPQATAEPKAPAPAAPVSAENTTQKGKQRDEDHQKSSVPPTVPPKAPDRSVDPKPAPSPQPEHEPEEEASKKKRQVLAKVNLIFTVKSQKANKGWVPKGSFQQKSLAELVGELPLEKPFDGLRLILQEIPGGRFSEYEVLLGDEDAFNSIKAIFRQRISEVRRGRAGSAKTVTFEMSISPIKDGEDEDGAEHQGDEDEDDIDDDFVY